MISFFIKRIKHNEHGAALIEFALIVPILLALLIGIIEFGWIYNGYISITGAAREGARLAARGEPTNVIGDAIEKHAYNFDEENEGSISFTITEGYPDGIDIGGEITVRVEGKLPLLVKFFGGEDSIIPFPNLSDPIPMSAEATMRREYGF